MQKKEDGPHFYPPGELWSISRDYFHYLNQGEVDQWEEKVRGLKEELLQLEAQKKGLEAYLRSHKGPCKVARTEKK